MPFRSYITVKSVIPLRSRRAAEKLRDKAKKKYGPKLELRLNGKSLIVNFHPLNSAFPTGNAFVPRFDLLAKSGKRVACPRISPLSIPPGA